MSWHGRRIHQVNSNSECLLARKACGFKSWQSLLASVLYFWRPAPTLFNNDHAVVKMHRFYGLGEICYLKAFGTWLVMKGVNLVNFIFGVLYKATGLAVTAPERRPVGRMSVFANVDTVLGNGGEQLFEGIDLLSHRMTTIVDQNIDMGNLLPE